MKPENQKKINEVVERLGVTKNQPQRIRQRIDNWSFLRFFIFLLISIFVYLMFLLAKYYPLAAPALSFVTGLTASRWIMGYFKDILKK